MLNMIQSTLEIGLERPVRLLHVTDTHMGLCDARDDARKQALAAKMGEQSASTIAYLEEQLAYARAHCDLLVHTGDLMDFVSQANMEKAREVLRQPNVFFIAGNHDYSQYVGEAWEDMAYRMNSYRSMGEGLGVNMFFNARTVGGVNLVGVDNCYHQVEDWQTERLSMEARKGLPIVLMLHVPIFEESLYAYSMSRGGDGSAYLMGCDEAHLLPYPEFRAMEQRPSEATRRFVEYVNHEPAIRAVLAGALQL